ncbi:MAG TPA: PLD nuclease N-terminal domain-containing protein [Jatrophihabitans sp.]|jgi:hypothetical protein|nr:PLD nuclease N-terminal domain-containing protein [Jatrophihabitans sp.]
MLFFDGALGLVLLAVWLFCIIDVITTPDAQIRNLPKLAWLLIVIVLVDLGSIAWLVAGRNWSGNNSLAHKGNRGSAFPEYERPGRNVASNPDDDEAFLRQLRERAEQQRQDYRTRREQELRTEREQLFGNRTDDEEPDPDGPN